jgi:hypothetical protein
MSRLRARLTPQIHRLFGSFLSLSTLAPALEFKVRGYLHGRYQFAASVMEGGQAVWRGDTITGRADLCATELVTGQTRSSDVGKTIVTKC